MNDKPTLNETLRQAAIARGYRFEVSTDGNEERMIRPDGSVAVIARRLEQREPSK
jgi:hypothetical protein